MTLKRRIRRLEIKGAEERGKLAGAVLIVQDTQNLTEAEAQELAAAKASSVVVLPDNGRGDRWV